MRSWTAGDDGSGSTSAAATDGTDDYVLERYESTMLTAPRISTWQRPGTSVAPGLLFTTPQTDVFSGVVYGRDGSPVWIAPTGETVTDLRVQRYAGRDVLTYWSGRVASDGHGTGRGVVRDASYAVVAEVQTGNGMLSDVHEFQLTDAGTALLIAYPLVRADLTAVGGPANGWMYDCHVQEVDVATGDVLLDWRMGAHVDLTESAKPLGTTGTVADTAYDPFHVNSVQADSDDTLLVSARHTSTVYSLNRTTGEVLWRLGGTRTDFTLGTGARFIFQHDARRRSASQITMFDNHTTSAPGASRGLVLAVDEDARTATVQQAYAHDGHLGTAMGSLQTLADGHVLVG